VTKIKICGLFREADVDFANEAGPDFIGFVFAESRRRVSIQKAGFLRSRLRDGIVPVGVFVNTPPKEIVALYRDGIIGMAQLHGREDAPYTCRLKTLSAAGRTPIPVIKALRMGGPAWTGWDDPALYAGADYLLLDSGSGSGKTFDWSLLGSSPSIPLPWFLAGGVSMENIDRALSYMPSAVDVSSGAETDGVKDRQKITALVKRVRGES
jgi:phosphoribosylanthranilate isomerase